MEKSPNFADFNIPDIPVGSVDKITTEIIKNANQQAQDVLSNKLDYMQDPPPADLKPTVEEQAGDRYSETTTGSTYYFFMNTRVAPFDNAKVREAVNYGIDKPGLARIFAGELAPGWQLPASGNARVQRGFRYDRLPLRRSVAAA